jgi:phospholipid/cholesterol/gamma-HCH transport system substrate-binding protein
MRRPYRRRATAALAAALAVMLTGCDYQGLNDFTLPGVPGAGPGAYSVQIELANVADLVPNNPVRVGDVPVGNIERIDLEGWTAVVTVTLDPAVELPRNVLARVGQASLLGAKYVELTLPTAEPPAGRLADGDRIGLEWSGKYPETEEVLASVAMLLNGGGLQNLKTITTELNNALGGRTDQFRSLLTELETFTAGLDEQRDDIVRAIDGLDRLAARLAEQNPAIDGALQAIPPGLEVLNAERENLTNALVALGEFGEATDRVVAESSDALATNIANLEPALAGLADAGDSLTDSLGLLGTLVFPLRGFGDVFQGDYINFWLTLDLTLGTLDQNFLTGTPFEGRLGLVERLLAEGGAVLDAADPLLAPVLPQEPGTPVGEPGLDALDAVVPNEEPPGPADRETVTPSPSADPEDGEPDEPGDGGLVNGLLGRN